MNKLMSAALALLSLAVGSTVLAQGIVIDHTSVMAVTNLSQATINQVAQFRWFFAHASVGDNMMSGVTTLHAQDTSRYPIQRSSDDGAPPSIPAAATIYDYARGNPDWSSKVSLFEDYASNGWRSPAVNIALNKFCWIDPFVDTNTYLASMQTLEGQYSDTIFVYMTIPLTGYEDSENDARNNFNRTLRHFCTTHNRVLFDVADIQSHDTNGTAYTYATSNQLMYIGFAVSEGDWHLNAVAQPWVARGFYALGAALLATDRDGDGMSDGQELIAGMCPTSSSSAFRCEASPMASSNAVVLSWPSTSNRIYTLQRMTNLLSSGGTSNLVTDAPATPPLNTHTDTTTESTGFYRLSVRQ